MTHNVIDPIEIFYVDDKKFSIDLYQYDGFYFVRVWDHHINILVELDRCFDLQSAKKEMQTLYYKYSK